MRFVPGRSIRPTAAVVLAAAMTAIGCTASATQAPPSATQAPPSAAAGTCPTSAPKHAAAGTVATVTIQTAKGTIVVKMEADLAPAAVGNFVALASCGYYDGVVFHRLVPGFVIQGGDGQFGTSSGLDKSRVGQGGPGYTIDDDPVTAVYGRGVVAMARTPAPHSEGSQFFIVLDDTARPALEASNTYAIMGHVTSGMDVVDAIATMPNSGEPNNAALDPVPMTKVTVSTP
jgi:peptidyl-prolyl cis-trans isomerase B (cyclophilin B)